MSLPTHRRDWKRTRATELLGLAHPIIQGPFGSGLSSLDLAAAVSGAGGLGSFGAQHLGPQQIAQLVADLHARIDGVFNVNLWVSTHDVPEDDFDDAAWSAAVARLQPLYDEVGIEPPARPQPAAYTFDVLADALIDAGPPVFSFVYGVPDPEILERCRAAGIVTVGTAITVEEAVALDEAGVDAIVASGFEAGGHRVAFLREAEDSLTGTMSLVPAVVAEVEAPVIAAGGIVTGRQVVAALTLGAEAVQIGTAFLATAQSGITAEHRAALSSGARRTRLTRVLSGRLARGLAADVMYDIETGDERIAPYPYQGWLMKPIVAAAAAQGRRDLVAFWAGQSAPLVRPGRDAAELVATLVQEADELLAK
ncbi:nitronate monooxygenase [Svornostia abyssi]|uniref:Propionate 3-nitronate monooxygenase n=1 Tax=Svornostia abyssi TaxID=2898438 RepID=A0ABY5PP11_9ACTN|nr:nitronate monooxygenase [Parviterribacteraceae bacterium J379]